MKKKIVMFLCAFSLLCMSACSGKKEQPEIAVESFENLEKENNSQEKEDTNESNLTNNAEKNTEILEGIVESIGTGSIVISKIYTYEMDGNLIAVSSSDDNGDRTLITVNLPEDIKYELRTVKNSGINGDADVTKSEASFSDIKQGANIKFTGYYVTQEKEFTANSVVIYKFV